MHVEGVLCWRTSCSAPRFHVSLESSAVRYGCERVAVSRGGETLFTTGNSGVARCRQSEHEWWPQLERTKAAPRCSDCAFSMHRIRRISDCFLLTLPPSRFAPATPVVRRRIATCRRACAFEEGLPDIASDVRERELECPHSQ